MEEVSETKQNLIDSFCILLRTKRIEKITIHELTQKAGYNRSTFYAYFQDIYDVLECIQKIVMKHIQHNLTDNFVAGHFESSFIVAFHQLHEKYETYYHAIFIDAPSSDFTRQLQQVVKGELIRSYQLDQKNSAALYAVNLYVSGVIEIVCEWIENGRDITSTQLGDLIRDLVVNGIGHYVKVNV